MIGQYLLNKNENAIVTQSKKKKIGNLKRKLQEYYYGIWQLYHLLHWELKIENAEYYYYEKATASCMQCSLKVPAIKMHHTTPADNREQTVAKQRHQPNQINEATYRTTAFDSDQVADCRTT